MNRGVNSMMLGLGARGFTKEPVAAPEAPVANPTPEPVPTAEPAAARPPTQQAFADKVILAAGGNPANPPAPTPGVPIGTRPLSTLRPSTTTPAGEATLANQVKSSAMRSWEYNPETQIFTVERNDGSLYRYGEVSREQVASFEKADSKGKAVMDIQNSNVQLARKPAGAKNWIFNKPTERTGALPEGEEDLTRTIPLSSLITGAK